MQVAAYITFCIQAFPTKSVMAAMMPAVRITEISYAATSYHQGFGRLPGENVASFTAVIKPAQFSP
jgi:hypothetical protein